MEKEDEMNEKSGWYFQTTGFYNMWTKITGTLLFLTAKTSHDIIAEQTCNSGVIHMTNQNNSLWNDIMNLWRTTQTFDLHTNKKETKPKDSCWSPRRVLHTRNNRSPPRFPELVFCLFPKMWKFSCHIQESAILKQVTAVEDYKAAVKAAMLERCRGLAIDEILTDGRDRWPEIMGLFAQWCPPE